MFGLLRNLVGCLLKGPGNKKPVPRRRPRIQLNLLELEPRLVPSTIRLWIGPANGTWNTAANWADPTGASGVPQTNDPLVFDQYTTYNGHAGQDTNSEDNMSGLSVGTIYVNPGYNHVITIDGTNTSTYLTAAGVNLNGGANATISTGGNVSVTGNFTFSAGSLSGLGIVKMGVNSFFNWTSGTISDQVNIGDSSFTNMQQPTMTISGNIDKTMNGGILNWGTITWTGQGNLAMGGDLYNNGNNGVFDIQTDASIGQSAGVTGEIRNAGILKKTQGSGTTAIAANFSNNITTNNGTLLLNSGTINFTGSAVSKGTVTLSGGNLETSSTFYVSAGSLSGVGTIIGNLSTDDYNADGSGSGTISPGLGQLNVTGNFTMTANGSFNVIINALGTTSVLNITGSATLNGGTLNVTNNWRSGAQNFTFMQYGSHTGSFAYYMIDVSSWQFQGQTYNLALLAPGASNYQLQSS